MHLIVQNSLILILLKNYQYVSSSRKNFMTEAEFKLHAIALKKNHEHTPLTNLVNCCIIDCSFSKILKLFKVAKIIV